MRTGALFGPDVVRYFIDAYDVGFTGAVESVGG